MRDRFSNAVKCREAKVDAFIIQSRNSRANDKNTDFPCIFANLAMRVFWRTNFRLLTFRSVFLKFRVDRKGRGFEREAGVRFLPISTRAKAP